MTKILGYHFSAYAYAPWGRIDFLESELTDRIKYVADNMYFEFTREYKAWTWRNAWNYWGFFLNHTETRWIHVDHIHYTPYYEVIIQECSKK